MKKIELTQGYQVIVDDEDYEELTKHNWHITKGKRYYAARSLRIDKKIVSVLSMHRQIMKLEYGDKRQVDHINGNGLDNRKENLRICTHSENCYNRKKTKINATSKYKGVYWDKQRKKWSTLIGKDQKSIHLGHYDNEIEAAKAYDKKALELFGEFAYINFKNK